MAWLSTALLLVLTCTLVVSSSQRHAAKIRGLRRLSPDSNDTPISRSYKAEKGWNWDKSDDFTEGDAVAQVVDKDDDDYEETSVALPGGRVIQAEYIDDSIPRLQPRSPHCPHTVTQTPAPLTVAPTPTLHAPPPRPAHILTLNIKPSGCGIPSEQRVRCSRVDISSSECEELGCCPSASPPSCFYPMDECTKDKHFVFAIHKDSTTTPVDPTNLAIPGTNCVPDIVNDQFAIYKFSINSCGARAYQIGDSLIYLAEVHTPVFVRNLKYGTISRDDPIRFLIECRYSKGDASGKQMASIGFMVKIPPFPFPFTNVMSDGLFRIELRIATDETYSSYHTHNHQPLHRILGKPVYLELALKSPNPRADLKVNYCLAYPHSASNALVLLYEGCANPLDPHVANLYVRDLPKNRYQKRFVVKAFQFMDVINRKFLDEEIYFMCSTELCLAHEKTCETPRCFNGR